MLFVALCTLDLRPRVAAKWSNCEPIRALRTGNIVFHAKKASLVQNVHNSVSCTESPWTCAERLILHHSAAFYSPYITDRKKTKNRTRPTKIRISVSKLYRKFRIMNKKGRLYDTPVQLVQNVHRFASCAIDCDVILLGRKAKNMVKSTVSVLFESLCTKDIQPRWTSPCKQSQALSTNNELFMNR